MKQKLLLIFAVLLTSLNAYASYDFEVNGIYYNVVSLPDLTCEVVSGDVKYSGDVVIPSKVTYSNKTLNVVKIGIEAFRECTALKSVNLPKTIETIDNFAFWKCSGLNSLEIPSSVKILGGGVFKDCTGLTSMVIPNTVTTFGSDIFYGCSNLGSVKLPTNLTAIPSYMFSQCKNLNFIDIPETVDHIGNYAFSSCSGLTSVKLPENLLAIGDNAFAGCTGLTNMVIPNSVNAISWGIFWNCTNLKTVTLSKNINDIPLSVFSKCSNLESITSLNPNPPSVHTNGLNPFNGVSKTECVIYVPNESVDAYKAADEWKNFWNIEGCGTYVDTNEEGFSSIYLRKNITLDGIDGYTYRVVGGELVCEKSYPSGSVVPESTALLLYSSKGKDSFFLRNSEEEGTTAPDNLLKGTETEQTITATGGEKHYVLANGSNGMGFYIAYNPTSAVRSFVNKANKAYLEIPESALHAPMMLSLGINRDGNTTAIENVEDLTQTCGEAVSLQGVKVKADFKGIVIINGKKELKK